MNAVLDRPPSYVEERGKPKPSLNHSVAQARLIVELSKDAKTLVTSELSLEFEGTTYTPDICIYPSERINWRHDEVRRSDPPLTVVEIFSPMQGPQSIMDKVEIYFRNGVKSVWLISPHLKAITILGPNGAEFPFHVGIARDPFTGLTADVGAVFS